MKNKKLNIRSLFVLLAFVFALFSANIVSMQFAKSAKAEEETAYEQTVNDLAESVGVSNSYQSFYQSSPVTLYNFVIVVRFAGEADKFNTVIPSVGLTYYQALNEMYNSQNNYSVNKYYKTVSNGLLDLKTVFVTTTSSYQTSNPRSTYGNADRNGGTGYDPDATIMNVLPEELALEYELLDELYYHSITTTINTPTYRSVADSDGNGTIDSLSIVLLPDPGNMIVGWSDLLWPHSSQTQVDIVETYGSLASIFGYSISASHFKYTVGSTTYKAGNYMMADFNDDEISDITNLPKNNTDIHELGHVLGWPDYYIYDTVPEMGETSSDSEEPASVWEIMAYSHLDMPQYPTTYSRSVQGWMPEGSVVEIPASGNYTLRPVNYEESSGLPYDGRVVAYKITNPDNPNQAIWFEYRSQQVGTFENNASTVSDGLLVYLVDEGFGTATIMGQSMGTKTPGNFAAAPYNLYVFRNNISGYSNFSASQRAPLNNLNRSMGDGATYSIGGRTYTATNITWQQYQGDKNTPQNEIDASDVTFVNSGMVVEIVSMAGQQLTFRVTYAPLTGDEINRSSFDDNNLYNRLLLLADKTTSDTLYSNDLANKTSLDLSNLSISSIRGMELLNLSSLEGLNLNFNNINSLTIVSQLLSQNSNLVVSLIGNRFNLTSLSSATLQNTHLIWGFQRNLYDNDHYVFNSLSHTREYFWSASYADYYTLTVNGNAVSTNNTTYQYFNFNQYGEYLFDFTPTDISPIQQTTFATIKVTVVSITTPSTNVERNFEFPSLVISGINASLLTINRTPVTINTANTTSSAFLVSWNLYVTAKPSATLALSNYYNIVDTIAPVVTLTVSTPLEVQLEQEITSLLPAQEITITDNAQAVSFGFNESPQAGHTSFWTRAFFKVNGATHTLVTDWSSVTYGEYAVGYMATDAYGNASAWVYRTIMITAEEVTKNQFADGALYDTLFDLVEGTKIYRNSLEGFSYIDLSSQNLQSAVGLEQFTYQPSTVIDLANNKITSMDGVNELLSIANVSKINLVFNMLASDAFAKNAKLVLGVQGIDQDIYIPDMAHAFWGTIGTELSLYNFDDQAGELNVTSNFGMVSGWNTLLNYGTFTINYASTGTLPSHSKTFKFGNIWLDNTSPSFDYPATVNALDLVSVQGISLTDVEVMFQVGMIEFDPNETTFGNVVGTQQITIDVFYQNQNIKSLMMSLNITDRVSPVLQLLGSTSIYRLVGQEYIEEGYSATDNYDPNPFVDTQGTFNINEPGVYTLRYVAFDQSTNQSIELTRTIYVGNVLSKSNVKVDVKTRVGEESMFDFVTFTPNDFNLTVLQSYNQNVLDTYTVSVRFEHKQDNNMSFDLDVQVKVVDRINPTITLTGPTEIYMYVGDFYTESGGRISDNYDAPRDISNITNTVNTNQIGTYIVTYNATDNQGNMAEPINRVIHVIAKPFGALEVILESNSESLYLGNVVRFKANISSYDPERYNYNSTFVWFVDGVEVKRASDITLQATFDEVGTHKVEVKVLNMNLLGQEETVDGQEFQFSIAEGGFLERFGVPILIGTSVSIVLAVIWSFLSRKRRKFYF